MAKQPYQVHVTSSDMKKLLEAQELQLDHVKSIRELLEEAQEGKRIAEAGDQKVVGEGSKDTLKVSKEELQLKKQLLELEKKSIESKKQDLKQSEINRDMEAKAIANLAKTVTALKTPGERLADLGKKIKSAMDPLNMLSKINIGGIFSRTINKEKFIRAQKAAGSTDDRSVLSEKFEKAEQTSKKLKANEAAYQENRKAAGLSDSEYSKTKEGKRLLTERSQLSEEHAKHDIRADMVRRDVSGDESSDRNTKKQPPSVIKADAPVEHQKAAMTTVKAEDLQKPPVKSVTKAEDLQKPPVKSVTKEDKPLAATEHQKAAMTTVKAEDLQKSPTQQFADAGASEEQQIEDARLMGEQTSLLEKIEKNTRGDSPEQKAKPAEEKGGGGLLGGLLGGGKGAAMLKGLKDFGVGLVLVAGSLWVAAKAFQEFAEVEWGGVMKGMVALGIMVAAAVGLRKASSSLKEVGVGLMAMSAALWIAAKALSAFAEVNWSDIGKGLIVLGGLVIAAIALDKVKGQILGGAVSLGVLGLALWGISEAFQTFANLKWEDIGKGMLAVAGIGAIGAIAGTAAPLLIAGGVALGALGAGLWVVGKAMQAVGEGFDKMTTGLEKLGQIDGGNLFKVAGGLLAVSAAMVAFGGAQALAGLGALVGKLLSFGQDSPMEQLEKISKYGEGIGKAGDGMKGLGEGMKAFSEIKSDTLKDTMKAMKEFPWEQATKFVAAGGKMSANGAKVEGASKANADEQAKSEGKASGGGNTTIVNAPVNNQTTQNQRIAAPIRNQESSQSRYIGQKYATF